LAILALYIIQRINAYFKWRAQIDAVGGPSAALLTGTQKHGGKLTIPNSRHKAMCKLVGEFPVMFRMWKGPFLPMIYLVSPESAKVVLDAKCTPKSSMMAKLFDTHLGDKSILIATGEKWKSSRKLFTPAFHFKVLDQYLKEMVDILDDFVTVQLNRTDQSTPLDMEDELVNLNLKILLQSVYSCESHANTTWRKEFVRVAMTCDAFVGARIDNPLHLLLPNWLYFKTDNGKVYNKDSVTTRNLSEQLIKERIESNKKRGDFYLADRIALGGRLDFLDLCLAHFEQENEIDVESVISQTTTFSSAGSNTAAAAVSFTLYCLAKNPEHLRKCQAEVDDYFKTTDEVSLNSLQDMKFLTMCYKEGTRIFPPIPRVVKDLEEPIDICGHRVDPGITIIVSIYSIHHNPTIWPDPEKFDPYRFSSDAPARDPYAHIIYSAGQRNCLGQKYADMMTKLQLAKILHSFDVSVDADYKGPELVPSVILKSANGVMLRLTPREKEPEHNRSRGASRSPSRAPTPSRYSREPTPMRDSRAQTPMGDSRDSREPTPMRTVPLR